MTGPALTDEQYEVLFVHEFTPTLACDHPSHARLGQPTPQAEWRVEQQHSHSRHCDPITVLLCPACVQRLIALDREAVVCRRCEETALGRDWWRILGRL